MLSCFPIHGRHLIRIFTSTIHSLKKQTRNSFRSVSNKPKVVVLGGPTATGKSSIAFRLRHILNGTVINADSTKMYKGLNIGTNKFAAESEEAEFRLTSFLDPVDQATHFSVGHFHQLVFPTIQSIVEQDMKLPIVVGGSGFYLRWLTRGKGNYEPRHVSTNQRILDEIRSLPWEDVVKRLSKIDPQYTNSISENNYIRAARAIEVFERSGNSSLDGTASTTNTNKPSQHNHTNINDFNFINTHRSNDHQLYDFRCFMLSMPRQTLFNQICSRCETMIHLGLFEEVWGLMKLGLTPHSAAGKAIGYRQTMEYLSQRNFSEQSFLKFLSDFQKHSRQLAHRQLTWFRKEPTFYPIDTTSSSNALATITHMLSLTPEEWHNALQIVQTEQQHQQMLQLENVTMRTWLPPEGMYMLPHVAAKRRTRVYNQKLKKTKQLIDSQLEILYRIGVEMEQLNYPVWKSSPEEGETSES